MLSKPETKVWYDKEYLRDRVGMYTNEQLIEKAFAVNGWMNRNENNEWVQSTGQSIITKLNALYTQDTIH